MSDFVWVKYKIEGRAATNLALVICVFDLLKYVQT